MTDKKPPIHTIRIGNIKASIWENQSSTGKTFFTTTVIRSYRDEHEQWHESAVFYPDDLPKIELATKKAFEFIHTRAAERQQPSQEQREPGRNTEKESSPSHQESQLGPVSEETNGVHVEKLAATRAGRKR
mgnify:CR=1 FL=1